MCGTCGCAETTTVAIEEDILSENSKYAEKNRVLFQEKNVLAINVMSSPGSGKTTLLAKTIEDLKNQIDAAVIVGDQQTALDAEKLEKTGVPTTQINTGRICHLDAHMLGHSLDELPLQNNTTLFIENIGNLVCPVLFELGESLKVVILSVTEGDNKPLKYPDMFHAADLVLITKMDLLPYVDFDIDQCVAAIKQTNPTADILSVSATKETGLHDWYQWLLQKR